MRQVPRVVTAAAGGHGEADYSENLAQRKAAVSSPGRNGICVRSYLIERHLARIFSRLCLEQRANA